MSAIQIEEGARTTKPLSIDLAEHIFARFQHGRIVVIAEHPFSLISSVRKWWVQQETRVLRERSSTLNPEVIQARTHTLRRMTEHRFSMRASEPPRRDEVVFATATQLDGPASVCQTLYVTYPLSEETLARFKDRMPSGSLIVRYS